MKRPQISLSKVDLRSLPCQVVIELAAGGLLIALLLRWIGW